MKIEIHTIRQIKDEDYWNWAEVSKAAGVPCDYHKLLKDGQYTMTTDLGYTKATTVYRIIKEN